MKSMTLVILFLALVVAAACPSAVPAQSKTARPAFTLHSRITTHETGGSVTTERTEYVSSSGAFRTIETAPDGTVTKDFAYEPGRGPFTVDRRRRVLVPEHVEVFSNISETPRTADQLRADSQFVRTESILGLTVYVHRLARGETPLTEGYFAPELGQFALKYVVFVDGAPFRAIEPMSITFGEPDAAMLRLPEFPVKEREPVSVGTLDGKASVKVQPAYPEAARDAGITGTVTVKVLVNEDGAVETAEAASGHPLLREAAEDAARHTRLSQIIAEGRPAKATGTLSFKFPPNGPSIPPDLAYATEFVRTLEASGLAVTSVHESHLAAMFAVPNKVAYIVTNKGVIEVVFFDGPTDADRIRVRSEPDRQIVEGLPTNGGSAVVSGSRPMYFYARGNLFVVTWDKDTDEAVRRALAQ